MAGRSRMPPHSMKGPPPSAADHEPPFGRPPMGPMSLRPHPGLLEEMRGEGPPFGHPRGSLFPPHAAAMIDERIAVQHQDLQGLLVDNQRLAATHVALKQELAAAQHELQRLSHTIGSVQAEKDTRFREVYERSMKMESELRGAESMRSELTQIRGEIQKLNSERQDLSGQIQMLTHEFTRANSEMQQAPAIKEQIDTMKHEIQHARACIEHEKKGYAENYEQGQVMQRNLVLMAREVEKLRAEVANAEKRARAAAAAGNQGPAAASYGGNYGNPGPDPSYGGNPYPAGYGTNPVPGAGGADGGGSLYGPGSGSGSGPGSGHSAWGAYDTQRGAHGRR